MHEYSIVQAMFDQIEAAAAERHALAVRRVFVRIGAGAGVDVSLFRTAYELYRERTICENGTLEVEQVPIHWICPAGHGDVPPGGPLACRECGRPAQLDGGDEIVLERLELEVA